MADTSTERVAARFKNKKKLDTGTVVYEYSDRQVAKRNNDKAKRLEKLRKGITGLRSQMAKDLKSSDPDKFLSALAVGLMDETYERVGNPDSASEGHFGVTGWKKKHVSFGRGSATISYVGKSGVKQKKKVRSKALVKALRDAYEGCDGDSIFCHGEGTVGADSVNAYLEKFDISAKDIRGYHANDVMKAALKAGRKGTLTGDPKKRKAQLKAEWLKALDAAAAAVGHEASTLRSQYLVPGLEDTYLKDGTVFTEMVKKAVAERWASEVASRAPFLAKIVHIDEPWVAKMRKDFLALLKNIPKVKDYKIGLRLKEAISLWTRRFQELFFDEFLNKSLKYDESLSDSERRSYDRTLRSVGWDLHIELGMMPLQRADDYWSEEARYRQFQQESRLWVNRVKRKGQKFWREVRYVIKHYEKLRSRLLDEPEHLQVEVPDIDRTVIEGFQVEVRGYRPDFSPDVSGLVQIREGLKRYRRRASQAAPILMKRQLPMVIDFRASLGKGGEYHGQHIMINGHVATGSADVQEFVRMMAHEMGHHIYQRVLGKDATDFWNKLIWGDYGELDLREVLDKWPGDKWAYEFVEYMANKDPILALQVDTIWQGYSSASWGAELAEKEDFQRLLDSGTTKIHVPKNPISGYAGKNPEEAFCETLGLLVAYGARAVLPQIRKWLGVIMPGEIKIAHQVAARWS